ncbi:MAG: spore protease YyaC [Clostridium sp.]|nr:spore protease YyaC [Clostridium sp.]
MNKDIFPIDSFSPNSYIDIGNFLFNNLYSIYNSGRDIIFICIGTDRCTGDSLGPLVGYKVKKALYKYNNLNIFIYGSLETPIHSKNIVNITNKIYNNFTNPYIIAIDSSLGLTNNIGKVFIDNDPIYPGSAVNKDLPPIGDLSIKGIVNISGSYEFLILQNTRLYTVVSLANCISKGILLFINKVYNLT